MRRSNVTGALHNPNGIAVNWQSPLPIENAVFSLSERRILVILRGF